MPIVRLILALLLGLTVLPLAAQSRADVLPERYPWIGAQARRRHILRTLYQDEPPARYRRLRARVPLRRLVTRARRGRPGPRLYAQLALAERRYPQLPALLAELLRTGRPIWIQPRDMVTHQKMSQVIYPSTAIYNWLVGAPDVVQFTPADSLQHARLLQQVDSVVLSLALEGLRPARILSRAALYSNHAYPGSYAAVRQLCLRELASAKGYRSSQYALALAEYHRPEDIALILPFGQNALEAVARFPDPAFWPLVEQHRHVGGRELYEAAASYQTPRAAQLLDSLDRSVNYESAPQLGAALGRYYCPRYDSLIQRLWLQRRVMTTATIRGLLAHDPVRAARLFAAGLRRFPPDHRGNIEYPGYHDSAMNMTWLMYRTIADHDSAALRPAVTYGIRVLDRPELEGLGRLIGQRKWRWAAPALLARLQTEPAYYNRMRVIRPLLAFHEPALSAEVRRIMAEKPADALLAKDQRELNQLLRAEGLRPLPRGQKPGR